MATIKDVAKIANVSIATVSHVLNGTRFVSEDLVERVEAAMRACDYEPNRTAKSLRRKRQRIIAFVVPDLSNVNYSAMLKRCNEIVFESGFTTYVIEYNQKNINSLINVFRWERPDGVVVIPRLFRDEDYDSFSSLGLPVVFMDGDGKADNYPEIISDNENALYNATIHLIKKGHERIAHVHSLEDLPEKNGYEKALRDANIQFCVNVRVGMGNPADSCVLEDLLAVENRPTAIVCSDYRSTQESIRAIRKKGLDYPEDISLVGFECLDNLDMYSPAITAISQNVHDLAKSAIESLMHKIEQTEAIQTKKHVPCTFLIRRSTQSINRGPFGEKASSPDELVISENDIEILKGKGFSVAISWHSTERAWERLNEKALKEEFSKLGIRLIAVTDAHFDPYLQIKQLQTLIDLKPDAIISIPIDEELTSDTFRKVIESKIKLVLTNNIPKSISIGEYVTCVSVNERENGQICGRLLGNYMKKNGRKKVGLIQHGVPMFATRQRDSSAEQVLREEFSELEIVCIYKFLSKDKDVRDITLSMIDEHPEVEGIVISWDGPAETCISTLTQIGRTDIAVVTSDLDADVALNMAKGGMVKGLTSQRPYEQGLALARATALALIGKKVPSFIGVQPIAVEPANLLKTWKEIMKEYPPAEIIEALKHNS